MRTDHAEVWAYLAGLTGRKWSPAMAVTWNAIFSDVSTDELMAAAQRFAREWDGKSLRPSALEAYVRGAAGHRWKGTVCSECAEVVRIGSQHTCAPQLLEFYRRRPEIRHVVGLCRVRGCVVESPYPDPSIDDQAARRLADSYSARLLHTPGGAR